MLKHRSEISVHRNGVVREMVTDYRHAHVEDIPVWSFHISHEGKNCCLFVGSVITLHRILDNEGVIF